MAAAPNRLMCYRIRHICFATWVCMCSNGCSTTWTATDISALDSAALNTQMLVCKVYPQVRGQAVEVLQRAEDDELACYLLQLTAALRYEPSDSSRLARFLVERWVSRLQ